MCVCVLFSKLVQLSVSTARGNKDGGILTCSTRRGMFDAITYIGTSAIYLRNAQAHTQKLIKNRKVMRWRGVREWKNGVVVVDVDSTRSRSALFIIQGELARKSV